MTRQDRDEVDDYADAHRHVAIRIGYSPRVKAYFAEVGARRGEHTASPIEAFRRAIAQAEIVGLLHG
jgi:hypothetical protein